MEKYPQNNYIPEHSESKENWIQDVLDFYIPDMTPEQREKNADLYKHLGRYLIVRDSIKDDDGKRERTE